MSDQTANQRLISLDVFRGLTIAGMVLVNNPGTSPVYWPLDHTEWYSLTPTDWIFPFFPSIVGVAIPIALRKYSAAGGTGRNATIRERAPMQRIGTLVDARVSACYYCFPNFFS